MAWILDVIFFVVLLLGCWLGAKVGLVKGVCKIAGWILSIVIPIVCCVAFKDALENWFGMVTAISGGVAEAFYGTDEFCIALARRYLDQDLLSVIDEITQKYCK